MHYVSLWERAVLQLCFTVYFYNRRLLDCPWYCRYAVPKAFVYFIRLTMSPRNLPAAACARAEGGRADRAARSASTRAPRSRGGLCNMERALRGAEGMLLCKCFLIAPLLLLNFRRVAMQFRECGSHSSTEEQSRVGFSWAECGPVAL